MAVTKVLIELKRITGIEVSLNPGQAKVNYDSSKINIEDLKGVITESGYTI